MLISKYLSTRISAPHLKCILRAASNIAFLPIRTSAEVRTSGQERPISSYKYLFKKVPHEEQIGGQDNIEARTTCATVSDIASRPDGPSLHQSVSV